MSCSSCLDSAAGEVVVAAVVVIRFLDSEGKGLWLALGEGTPKLNMRRLFVSVSPIARWCHVRELWQRTKKEEMSNT
jgi:hypothetical protein